MFNSRPFLTRDEIVKMPLRDEQIRLELRELSMGTYERLRVRLDVNREAVGLPIFSAPPPPIPTLTFLTFPPIDL